MKNPLLPQRASCTCGASAVQITGRPLLRFICHCTICREFTQQPFNDVTLMWADDVILPEGQRIIFKRFRPPPAVERGSCPACGTPVVEFASLGPTRFAFVPSSNYSNANILPEPAMHIFYHRRVEDIADNLPKYSGYVRSQLQVVSRLLHRIVTA